MLSLDPKVDLEWSGDCFQGLQSILGIWKRQKCSPWAPQLIWSGLKTIFGDFGAFSGFQEKAQMRSKGPKVIWSGFEIIFADFRPFSGFPEKAKRLCIFPKVIWSGLEIIFGDFKPFSGFPERAKMLSVGPKVDLEWSGGHFRGFQSIFGISGKGENALCGP